MKPGKGLRSLLMAWWLVSLFSLLTLVASVGQPLNTLSLRAQWDSIPTQPAPLR